MARPLFVMAVACAAVLPAASFAQASSSITRDMAIDQKMGAQLPADDAFKDESGKSVKLGDYLGKRPLLILPVFYNCKSYCQLEISSLIKTLSVANHPIDPLGLRKQTPHILRLGKDLDVLMVSIDPKETPELAANKKTEMMTDLSDQAAPDHWHLLTGTNENIHRFTDAIGFKYHYDAAKDLIRHPTCSVVVTPSGQVSSYIIGYDFPTVVLERSLSVAAENKVGEKADQSFMFGCLMLDPATGKIRVVVEGIMRVAAAITLLVVGFGIFFMVRQERKTGSLNGLKPI